MVFFVRTVTLLNFGNHHKQSHYTDLNVFYPLPLEYSFHSSRHFVTLHNRDGTFELNKLYISKISYKIMI